MTDQIDESNDSNILNELEGKADILKKDINFLGEKESQSFKYNGILNNEQNNTKRMDNSNDENFEENEEYFSNINKITTESLDKKNSFLSDMIIDTSSIHAHGDIEKNSDVMLNKSSIVLEKNGLKEEKNEVSKHSSFNKSISKGSMMSQEIGGYDNATCDRISYSRKSSSLNSEGLENKISNEPKQMNYSNITERVIRDIGNDTNSQNENNVIGNKNNEKPDKNDFFKKNKACTDIKEQSSNNLSDNIYSNQNSLSFKTDQKMKDLTEKRSNVEENDGILKKNENDKKNNIEDKFQNKGKINNINDYLNEKRNSQKITVFVGEKIQKVKADFKYGEDTIPKLQGKTVYESQNIKVSNADAKSGERLIERKQEKTVFEAQRCEKSTADARACEKLVEKKPEKTVFESQKSEKSTADARACEKLVEKKPEKTVFESQKSE
ncbi:conserved Plasmodium protein, unknown function, partial [Plasmodium relictum]